MFKNQEASGHAGSCQACCMCQSCLISMKRPLSLNNKGRKVGGGGGFVAGPVRATGIPVQQTCPDGTFIPPQEAHRCTSSPRLTPGRADKSGQGGLTASPVAGSHQREDAQHAGPHCTRVLCPVWHCLQHTSQGLQLRQQAWTKTGVNFGVTSRV